MKKKTILTATLAGVAACALTNNYQKWKRDELVRSESQSQLVTTPLGPVEYALQGEGPAVLMIHGSPGGYDQGLGLAHLIDGPDFTYIAPSRPGYLRTPLSAGVSPEAQADLYAALLDALQIEQVIVLGMSGGGASALQFVLRHPRRCRGLIMLCAVTQRYVEKEYYQQFSAPLRLGKQLINELVLFDPFIYGVQALGKLVNPGITADLFASLSPAYLRKEGYRNDMRQFAAMTPYPLEQINIPTFIAQGTADTELPFTHAQLLASKVPHAQLIAVPGAGHVFFLTHQEQFMPALSDFLATFHEM
ncbi:MAG: alpha/beta fold hydrolase [Ktedonobacteraceae bacterium]